MADSLPPPSPEHRRIAAERFERARQVITTGNLDYGVQLLLACCKLDPANLIYRQELRRAQKKKHNNNMRGGALALLTTLRARAKMSAARRKAHWVGVLEHGEDILTRNPWDKSAQLAMGQAADELGLTDMGIFILDQARQSHAKDVAVNRALARLLEKRGHFTQAIKLWELVRQAIPTDPEASSKAKDLAASETIQRGHYQSAVTSDDPIRGVLQHNRQKAEAKAAEEESKLHEKLTADPTEPSHYLDVARNMRKAGKSDDAIDLLRRGLAATGNDFAIQVEIAELELEPFRKNFAAAEAKLKAQPDDADLAKNCKRLAKEINSREMDLYRMKADRNPGELQNRLELGTRLYRAKQYDEAIAELQAARKDERLIGKATLYLGHCFKNRNNWRLAQRNYEEAMAKLPASDESTRKEILFALASGTAEAGDLAKAIDLAHELANMDFGYKQINRLLDEWQAKLQSAG